MAPIEHRSGGDVQRQRPIFRRLKWHVMSKLVRLQNARYWGDAPSTRRSVRYFGAQNRAASDISALKVRMCCQNSSAAAKRTVLGGRPLYCAQNRGDASYSVR